MTTKIEITGTHSDSPEVVEFEEKKPLGGSSYDWHHVKYTDAYPGNLYAAEYSGLAAAGIKDWDAALAVKYDGKDYGALRTLLSQMAMLLTKSDINYPLVTKQCASAFNTLSEAGVLKMNNVLCLVCKEQVEDMYATVMRIVFTNDEFRLADMDKAGTITFKADGTVISNTVITDIYAEVATLKQTVSELQAMLTNAAE